MSSKNLRSPLTLAAIPSNVLLSILKKLTAVPLCRLRRTCSSLNNFVEENHETLSRRIFNPPKVSDKTSLHIFISQDMDDDDDCNHFCIQWHQESNRRFYIEIDKPEEAAKYLSSGIPIRMITVVMSIVDRPSLLSLVDFLKPWNLFSKEMEFHCPAECSVDILECVRADKYSLHASANVENELVVLRQSVKKDQLIITVVIMPDENYDFLNECYGFKEIFCMFILREDVLNEVFRTLHVNGLRERTSFNLCKLTISPLMPAELDPMLPIRILWDVTWISSQPGYQSNTFVYKYIATLQMGKRVGILTNHIRRYDFVQVQVIEWEELEEKLFSMMREGKVISPQFQEKESLLQALRIGDRATMKNIMVNEYLNNNKE